MRTPDLQCCICLAVCDNRADAEYPHKWQPHDRLLNTSHGYCPRCYRDERAKLDEMTEEAAI